MSQFYNIDGEEISMVEWCRLLDMREYAVVAYDEVGPGIKVSTVWLGLDHSIWGTWLGDAGPRHPIIFETMVFTLKDEPYMINGTEYWWEGVDQYRYSTLAAAEAGHITILEMVKVLENV